MSSSPPYPELDGRDLLAETRHFWLEQADGRVIATLRPMEEHPGGERPSASGRVCTKRRARGHGHTTPLLWAALDLLGPRIVWVRTVGSGKRVQHPLQDGDVVGRGVRPDVARPHQPGQWFTTGGLGVVQKHQQRVMAERLLQVGAVSCLLCGVIDGDGGIDIEVQPFLAVPGAPAAHLRALA